MKRVLCILSGMNVGGAETFLMKIYRNLDRSKYQMDFCVNIFEEGFYDKEIISMGGKIFHIPSKSDNIKEFKRQLSDIIRIEEYCSVLRVTSNTMGFMDLKIAKKAGANICIARSSNSNDPAGVKAKIAHTLGRFLYSKYVDVKIAPSDLAAKYTFGKKAYKNGEVKILHNALDLNIYKFDRTARESIRKEFEILDSEVLCGHIGRFSEQKNHGYLIDIFYTLYKNNPNYKLLLVGKGELEESIWQKCNDLGLTKNVIFAGVRSDIPAILSAMDIFVFPSLYEGMPNTVVEAQAVGLPCIISNTITKEADISEKISYMSIDVEPTVWAKNIEEISLERYNAYEKFLSKHYDISGTVNDFVKYVFED